MLLDLNNWALDAICTVQNTVNTFYMKFNNFSKHHDGEKSIAELHTKVIVSQYCTDLVIRYIDPAQMPQKHFPYLNQPFCYR